MKQIKLCFLSIVLVCAMGCNVFSQYMESDSIKSDSLHLPPNFEWRGQEDISLSVQSTDSSFAPEKFILPEDISAREKRRKTNPDYYTQAKSR